VVIKSVLCTTSNWNRAISKTGILQETLEKNTYTTLKGHKVIYQDKLLKNALVVPTFQIKVLYTNWSVYRYLLM
jgi:hypothetical protein